MPGAEGRVAISMTWMRTQTRLQVAPLAIDDKGTLRRRVQQNVARVRLGGDQERSLTHLAVQTPRILAKPCC